MTAALRTVRLVQIAMLASIVLYVIVGENISSSSAGIPNGTFFYAISFISISIVGGILVIRRTLILQSEAGLRDRPDDPLTLGRWRAGYIVTYALCETLALFGLVLRLLGLPRGQIWPFYVAGFVLMALTRPRAPRPEIG